ncbi:MAG: cell division protein FtsA [Clostridia bacterium]|nr:cell division protein FtsA [Clostridia bacterium]
MAIGDIIIGVDIGTSKVSLVVGEVNNFNQIEVTCNTSHKCNGIKKMKIIDEDEVALAIHKVISEAEQETDLKIHSAYVTIPGKYVTIVQNSVTREAKDKYAGISTKDVSSAIMQVKDVEVPEGKTIIDIVTDKFIMEDGKPVIDPIGNLSSNFSLNAQVVLADKEYIKEIVNIFKKAGLEVDGFVPVCLAQRNVMLDNNEMNDNILLLDIGAGNTDLAVFEGNGFIYTNTIPLGGDSITSDISLVLNIEEEEAERLKRQYGLAMKSYIDNDNEIILNTYRGESKTKAIKSSELIEIIEARIEEIFTLVNKDLMAQGIKQRINNVVLTGQGIANINKSDVAGKVILNIPVKISTGRLISTVRPEFRTAYSLVRYIAARPFAKTVSSSIDTNTKENIFSNIVERVKEFFYS